MEVNSSNLLVPLHSIGFVTDEVPFVLEKLGDEYFIVVATGHYYQVYDLDQLRIKYISQRTGNRIENLAAKHETVFVSMGNIIEGYNRHEKTFEVEHKSKVKGMLVLGELLISWDKGTIIVSELASSSRRCEILLDMDVSEEIVTVLHPVTYLNKVLVVTSKKCELWNINTRKLIHRFSSIQDVLNNSKNIKTKLEDSDQQKIITAVTSSHPDVVGIATKNGMIYTLDIANDLVLLSLEHMPEQKGVTSISFCSEKAILISGCENGDIVLWDLENARVLSILNSVHESEVVKVQFVPGVSMFVTSGRDNALLEFVIDNQNSPPRELRSRRGHLSSIIKAKFYDALPEKSRDLLCISNFKNCGYLGKTSTIQQHQNRIFSQNSLKKKFNEKYQFPFNRLPTVIDMSFAESRHFDWPNIVTIHQGMHEVFVWSGHNFALTPKLITLENIQRFDKQSKNNSPSNFVSHGLTAKKKSLPLAKAVSVSGCGNYVIVGYSDGSIHRFNLQSCTHSGQLTFPENSEINQPTMEILSIHISHSTMALCILRDLDNYYLSAWSIKPIKYLNTKIILSRVSILSNVEGQEAFVSKLFGYLLAFGFSDGRVILYDFQSQVISREFQCGNHTILDITMSSDNRWIVISTKNSELFIFDIISSNLLDWIKFKSPAICCVFDHSDAFLITSHDQSKGLLSVWANKHVLSVSVEIEGLSNPPSEPYYIDDPPNRVLYFEDSDQTLKNNKESTKASDSDHSNLSDSDLPENGDSDPSLTDGKLMSFSGIPFSTLQAILFIDEIKERNKPIEPPKKPESAPFFLPNTTEFSSAVHKLSKEINQDESISKDLSESRDPSSPLKTELQELLAKKVSLNDSDFFLKITKLLKSKSPSGVNLLLRQLGPLSGGSFEEIAQMIHYFNISILNRTDSELIQTYLNIFLTIHSTTILENESEFKDIQDIVLKLNKLVKNDWDSLQNRLQNISCFLKLVTNIQMD
ncbi:beta transducin with WD40 repeats [Cryptosporidium ubiquitum]|uniref:Beta transducin with WD40 repeats n=1 Tax=Cryptosporidium ubiquitum TaxID=857276 RepID=A0A1J4MMQ0_9CRYT|nr:beta transducin with WD40 repeats [Cryptosporidium ubiquitum]OII74731.1 beta transducin with WD40 repeats [Cryptosporidium ubiquitum]